MCVFGAVFTHFNVLNDGFLVALSSFSFLRKNKFCVFLVLLSRTLTSSTTAFSSAFSCVFKKSMCVTVLLSRVRRIFDEAALSAVPSLAGAENALGARLTNG
jgi:hypothetical protein